MSRNPQPQVRYISPFSSPAWMSRNMAEDRLAVDEEWWRYYRLTGQLTIAHLAVGAPRIEPGDALLMGV